MDDQRDPPPGPEVRDVDASAVWYQEVLGFRRDREYEAPDGARRKVFLRHDGLDVRLGLTQHWAGDQEPFDEMRVGLDHLAFKVADRVLIARETRRVRGLRGPFCCSGLAGCWQGRGSWGRRLNPLQSCPKAKTGRAAPRAARRCLSYAPSL